MTILLTPGPLTTSRQTRDAMMVDWGSRDSDFTGMCATICKQLIDIINGEKTHVCVPLQGSGTFAVEAALGTLVSPKGDAILILSNGAYGRRMKQICDKICRKSFIIEWPESEVTDPTTVDSYLTSHPEATHVALVHCETSVGIMNPLHQIAKVIEKHKKKLIVDAMSSLGALPIDVTAHPAIIAVIAASGKCLEGVPGMAFVLVNKLNLLNCKDNAHSIVLDLYDQFVVMEKTGQWRFTPPTHVVAALHSALSQFISEGGQKARLARYQRNMDTLSSGLDSLGVKRYLRNENQAPIIMTCYTPVSNTWDFNKFYNLTRSKGFAIYPGKLTAASTFRVGCIGDVQPEDLEAAVDAIRASLNELGI